MPAPKPKPIDWAMPQPVHHRYLIRFTAMVLALVMVFAPLPIGRSFRGAALN